MTALDGEILPPKEGIIVAIFGMPGTPDIRVLQKSEYHRRAEAARLVNPTGERGQIVDERS